jgi:type IX secretion system PorP/SprF family membrane protein
MKRIKSFQKKLVACIFAGVLASSAVQAQQEVMYSQYMFNTMAINPAYAGSRDVLSLTALGRYQWMGVNGAPTTYSFTMDMPVSNEKMGVGLTAFSDAIGHQRNTGLGLAYSYKFKVSEKTTLSLGVSPNVTQVGFFLSKVGNLTDPDAVFNSMNDVNRLFVNVGTGLFLSNDKSYIGFSVPQLIEHKLNPFESEGRTSEARMRRHYFTMMGFVVGKGNVKLKPSMMVRYTNGSGMGFDGNLNLWFKDKIAVGVSGRKSQPVFNGVDLMDAVVGMLEFQLTPQLRFGYAYDVNLNRLNSTTKTGQSKLVGMPTHEGLLRYEFGFGKNKIITPRYF